MLFEVPLKNPNGRYKPEVIAKCVDMVRRGMTSIQVEALTGVKRRSISHHARKAGIDRSNAWLNRHPHVAKEIRDLYVGQRYSRKQVAEFLDLPEGKVRRFLEREGLTRDRLKALRIALKRKRIVRSHNRKALERKEN